MQGSGGGVVMGVVVMLGAMLGLGCQTRGRGTRVVEFFSCWAAGLIG